MFCMAKPFKLKQGFENPNISSFRGFGPVEVALNKFDIFGAFLYFVARVYYVAVVTMP